MISLIVIHRPSYVSLRRICYRIRFAIGQKVAIV